MTPILNKFLPAFVLLTSIGLSAENSILYIGSLFPKATQEYYGKLQERLQKHLKEAGVETLKDTLPNKMHVTLKFVGIMDDAAKQAATEKIREIFANEKFPRLTMKPKGFKVLPQYTDSKKPANEQRPSMILATVESPALENIYKTFAEKLVASGVAKADPYPFLAHMTIGTFDPNQQLTVENLQKIVDGIPLDDVTLEISDMQLLSLPASDGGTQYQNPVSYEEVLTFPGGN